MAPMNDARHPDPPSGNIRSAMGWTKLHSWIFLAIVTGTLAFMAFQNRYQYFPPQEHAKPYRVDKLFGQVQLYESERGWVPVETSQEVSVQPTRPTPIVPRPNPTPQPSASSTELPQVKPNPPRPVISVPAPVPPPEPPSVPAVTEPTRADKWAAFHQAFPTFGKEEFDLAADDLYPTWKARANRSGTWPEFLEEYRRFIDWWIKKGSPADQTGVELWNAFLKDNPR